MKTLTILLFTAATLLAQPPVIPLQPNQQINQTFQNINKNSYYLDSKSVVCTGVGVNTITCNPNPPVISASYALTAYSPGMIVALTMASSNTGASTLNIASIGAVPILSASGAALTSGQLAAGTTYSLDYTGSAFVITGSSAGGTGVPSIAGTTNQITQSGSPGAVTLSLPTTLIPPGTVAAVGAISGSNINASFVGGAGTALLSGGALGTPSSGTATNLTGFPTLNQNTTGNAATATALAALPTPCSTGFAPTGILANGNSTGCASIAGGGSVSSVTIAGTANQITATGTCTITSTGTCTLSLPSGLILPGTVNGLTITTTTGTFTISSAKVLTVSNSLTLAGTDGVTLTFPSTNATIARTDAAQTFTGTQTFSTPIGAGSGGTGVSNTATITLGTANHNYATLQTGIIKNTTTTGALSAASSSDVTGLFSGGAGCTGTNYLAANGTCQTASGSAGFSALTSGTNTTAAMLVGTGASLGPTGSGTLNANQVNGAVAPASATVTATNASAQLVAAAVQGSGAKVQLSTGTTTTNDCVKFDANGNTVDAGSGCAGSLPIQANGTGVGTASAALNYLSGTYITQSLSCSGGVCSYQPDVDVTKIPTNAAIQTGQLLTLSTTSASATTYTAVMAANDPIAAYVNGQQFSWPVGSTACAGGAMTMNIDGHGQIPLKMGDGVTNMTPSMCAAGMTVPLIYNAALTVFQANYPANPGYYNVKNYGATGNGSTDDTTAINAATALGPIFVPCGNYATSNSINLNQTAPVFQGESGIYNCVVIANSNNSVPAISYLSPTQTGAYEKDSVVHISGATIFSQNGIQINTATIPNDPTYQANLVKLDISDMSMQGNYTASSDSNAWTSVVPSIASLVAYGYGISCTQCFRMNVTNTQVKQYGVGLYYLGDELLFQGNRYTFNGNNVILAPAANNIYTLAGGNNNAIISNTLGSNLRVGAIRLSNQVGAAKIQGNYFENYCQSATALYSVDSYGTDFSSNLIDNSVNPALCPGGTYAAGFATLTGGNTLTWVSNSNFTGVTNGQVILFNGAYYTVGAGGTSTVLSVTPVTVATNATNQGWSVNNAPLFNLNDVSAIRIYANYLAGNGQTLQGQTFGNTYGNNNQYYVYNNGDTTNPWNTPSVANVVPCGQITGCVHAIGAAFDGGGSALTTSSKTYFTVPFACTINAWNMTVDTGTATVDVWKIATGTAIPTISNTITASALPAIASGTALHSTTLTGWTTSVTANDIFGYAVSAVSGATRISLVLQCQ